jgi:hypothetical protein
MIPIPSSRDQLLPYDTGVAFFLDDIGRKNIRIQEILRLVQHFVFETRENY